MKSLLPRLSASSQCSEHGGRELAPQLRDSSSPIPVRPVSLAVGVSWSLFYRIASWAQEWEGNWGKALQFEKWWLWRSALPEEGGKWEVDCFPLDIKVRVCGDSRGKQLKKGSSHSCHWDGGSGEKEANHKWKSFSFLEKSGGGLEW